MKCNSCAWIHVIAYTKAAAIPIPYSMGEQASERAWQARQQRGPAEWPGLSLFLIRWGLLTIQEPISEGHNAKAEGESRDVDDRSPSAHHVHRVDGDDVEGGDEGRSGKDEEPSEDGEDGAEDVHCVAPFM